MALISFKGNMKMKEHMRRLYLYNRVNGSDTVAYVQESVLTDLNSEIRDFNQLEHHISPPAREAALNRLDAAEHQAQYIEVTAKHYSLMGWEACR